MAFCKRKITPESLIKNSIKNLLKTLGIFHFSVLQGLGSAPGVPDIIACYKGRLIGIEVKMAKGVVSPAQERFLANINEAGGLGIVARSVDDVIENLGLQDRFLLRPGR